MRVEAWKQRDQPFEFDQKEMVEILLQKLGIVETRVQVGQCANDEALRKFFKRTIHPNEEFISKFLSTERKVSATAAKLSTVIESQESVSDKRTVSPEAARQATGIESLQTVSNEKTASQKKHTSLETVSNQRTVSPEAARQPTDSLEATGHDASSETDRSFESKSECTEEPHSTPEDVDYGEFFTPCQGDNIEWDDLGDNIDSDQTTIESDQNTNAKRIIQLAPGQDGT